MSCHPARIPPGWRRGVPGRCFVQSAAPARFRCWCGMGPRGMGQSVRWDGRAGVVHRQNRLAARCGQPQDHGAAGARVLDGIIQQDHRQPMQGGGIPLHGLAGVRPLQSGYSPERCLSRKAGIMRCCHRYSIPQSAENRLKKCGRFLRLPHLRYSSSKISAATSARSRRVSMAVFSIMRWASASLMPLCSIR